MRIALLVLLVLAPVACAAAAPDPLALFEGASQGRGTLRLGLGRARPYTVDNRGVRDADGTLRLMQVVHMSGAPDRHRDWVIRPQGGGRYVFTLTDAVGPGVAQVTGPRIDLRFAPRHGVRMHQVLVLSPDGRTLSNVGRIRVLGVPIGRLVETISRTAPER